MTLARKTLQDAASGAIVTDTPAGFAALSEPGCAAVIWHRRPLPDFQKWIDAVDPENLPHARMILRPQMVRDAVIELCEAAALPPGPERTMLVDDVAALADIFAAQMKTPFVRVRLEPVSTNACRRFHVDKLTARLICTYRGTGTQYGISTGGEAPQRVFTVPTGAPVMLTGTDWPGRLDSGLLHRSPPVEASGETRLVLVLDPIQEPEDAA